MLNDVTSIINEVNRLINLPMEKRRQEGIYADTSQLKFLLKKLNGNKINSATLSGMAKFISDLSSSDSKILALIDKLWENKNA